ncbi:MAG TPA: glycosyltransferase family 2 protein [Tepidiformaceae bacterium]
MAADEASVEVSAPRKPGRQRLTVVVTTYERPGYLKQSLAAIAAQTAKGSFRVVVQDNASTADYSTVIAEYVENLDLEYVRNETNLGAAGNIEAALTRYRDTEYLTVFHDDDLMHPRMLEWQLQLMDSDPSILFAATQCTAFEDGTTPSAGLWQGVSNPACMVFDDEVGLVRGILSSFEPAFSSVMYRTSVLDRVCLDFERFNLYCDRPYLVEIARLGKSALITAPLVLYRIHSAQDTNSGALTLPIMIELMKFYRETLGVDASAEDRTLFMKRSTSFVAHAYTTMPRAGRPSLPQFLYRTKAEGVLRLRDIPKECWFAFLEGTAGYGLVRLGVRVKQIARSLRTVGN